MTDQQFATSDSKVVSWLFRNGFKIGYNIVSRDMITYGPFIRLKTSQAFCDICLQVILDSAWQKRKHFKTHIEIRNYAVRCAILLTERELDRQAFLARLLVFTWKKHHAGAYRIEPIPEFIIMLARRYNTLEITNQVEIPPSFGGRLLRDSFDRIRIKHNNDSDFLELWNKITAKVLKHSSEQVL